MPRALVDGGGETSWQTGCRRRASSTLPFAMSLLVALTVSHSFSQSLYLSLSLSLSLSRTHTICDRRGLAVFNLYTYALVQAASIYGGVIPPWSQSFTAAAAAVD